MEARFVAGSWRHCWAVIDRHTGTVATSAGAPWLCETEADAVELAERAEAAWQARPLADHGRLASIDRQRAIRST